jgi:multicomponent Na+:H+ antiporter subunit C
MGAAILSNGVNLLIFTAGRITREVPPIIGADSDVLQASAANPLPQALVLTAIVIAFSFFAFLLVLGLPRLPETGHRQQRRNACGRARQ